MKNLISTTETQTITLKEITDLLEIRHNDAMKVVEKMAESPEFGDVTKSSYRTTQGNEYETYALDKRQSVAVAAKLNTPLLMRVIDRWQELEANKQPKVPTTFIEAMQLATATLIENQALQETIGRKDQLLLASNEASIKAGEILIREFVKSNDCIELSEHQFFHWMRDQKIISEKNEPFQRFVSAGYFTFKPTEEMRGGKFRYTLRVTARGKIWLESKYLNFLDRVANDLKQKLTDAHAALGYAINRGVGIKEASAATMQKFTP